MTPLSERTHRWVLMGFSDNDTDHICIIFWCNQTFQSTHAPTFYSGADTGLQKWFDMLAILRLACIGIELLVKYYRLGTVIDSLSALKQNHIFWSYQLGMFVNVICELYTLSKHWVWRQSFEELKQQRQK